MTNVLIDTMDKRIFLDFKMCKIINYYKNKR